MRWKIGRKKIIYRSCSNNGVRLAKDMWWKVLMPYKKRCVEEKFDFFPLSGVKANRMQVAGMACTMGPGHRTDSSIYPLSLLDSNACPYGKATVKYKTVIPPPAVIVIHILPLGQVGTAHTLQIGKASGWGSE